MGRFAVVWGNRSATKSTLCLWSIAAAQKMGKTCAYLDTEKTFDSEWAERHGVDTKSLYIIRLNDVEDILEATKELLEQGMIDLLVLDSINALNYAKYFEDGNNSIGLQSKAIGEILQKWNRWNDNTLILLISQVRTKIERTYAYAEYSGGYAVDHYASVIVKLFSSRDKDSYVLDGKDEIGQKIRWEITKSKISPPHRTGSYIFLQAGGVDVNTEAIELGISSDNILRQGSWFYIGEEKFHGEAQLKEYLDENPDVAEGLLKEILNV